MHGLQANKHGANPLLAELAASRRAREARKGVSNTSEAAKEATAIGAAAPAARAAPALENSMREAQRVAEEISILSYNIWYLQQTYANLLAFAALKCLEISISCACSCAAYNLWHVAQSCLSNARSSPLCLKGSMRGLICRVSACTEKDLLQGLAIFCVSVTCPGCLWP